jgi:hypothetical protein
MHDVGALAILQSRAEVSNGKHIWPGLDDQLRGGRFVTVPPLSIVALLFFSVKNCLKID